MRNIRLIAGLDIKGPNLIKGIHLEGLRIMGSPNKHALCYYLQGADELIYMDCVASLYGRNHLGDIVKAAAKDIFVPMTVGGGIRSVDDATKVHLALSEIQKLYAIERQIADKPADEKRTIRQARAGPILSKMRDWLDKSRTQVPPKGTLGKALSYLDGEWQRLIRYIDDGRLPIDNNPCENVIRPFVIGRKNWLFSQSQAGVEASAAIYSLIETAKRSGHEPWHYLNHVLTALPTTKPDDLEKLLPHNIPAITFNQV